MPKRIIDGEALWTSTKLESVQPPCFRLHYANWLPMAEANGVFEANPDVIRARIYGYMLPTFTKSWVAKLLNEFRRVGLVSTYLAEGKMWGYFNGIHKPGRLPTDTHLSRYKNLPPNPPRGPVRDSPGDVGSRAEGFGLVRFGLDRLGVEDERQDQDMTLKTKITDKARAILGTRLSDGDKTWGEITALGRVYGQTEVVDAFATWAKTRAGEPCYYPLSEFIRIADSLLHGDLILQASPDAKKLIDEMTFISQGSMVPDTKQSMTITRWLDEFPAPEILTAFRTYYSQQDDFQIKHAMKNFCEKGLHLIQLARRNKTNAEELAATMARQRLEMAAETEERNRLLAAKLAAEQPDEEFEIKED